MGQVYGERWEIVRDLGQGGQGQAFLVNDRNSETAEQYVLKRLINVKRSARFEKEVEAISKLNHPNVLRLVDSDVKAEPRPYLVTEKKRNVQPKRWKPSGQGGTWLPNWQTAV